MFQLLSEGAHAFELSIGGRESVFVVGHRHGQRKESSLEVRDGSLKDVGDVEFRLNHLLNFMSLLRIVLTRLRHLLRDAIRTYCHQKKCDKQLPHPSHRVSSKRISFAC